MITKGDNPDHRICVVDGEAIIESNHTSSEVYLVPELATQLSAGSTSSSVLAETGAPELCHDVNSLASDDEEKQSPLRHDSVFPEKHEYRCPHYLQSTLKPDRNGCEIVLNSSACNLQPLHDEDDGNDHDSDRSEDDDVPYFISSSVNVEQAARSGSMGASSITLSDAFSIDYRKFDFGQRLMPEMTPRRRQRQRNLSIIATTPSRYQRPVDSLLISQKHPTPINTNAIWRKQENENGPPTLDSFGYENLDPQSPTEIRKNSQMKEYLSESKWTLPPKSELKARCANNIHPLSPTIVAHR